MAHRNIPTAKWVAASAALLLFVACAATTGAGRSGFLESYSVLEKGKYLEKFWSDDKAARSGRYNRIYIEPVLVDEISRHRKVSPEDCKIWLESLLKKHAGEQYITAELTMSDEMNDTKDEPAASIGSGRKKYRPSGNETGAPARMELSITEMHTGSRAGRFFAGSMHAGQAKIRVEGRVVDSATGELIAAFSVKRKSYSAIGVGDIYKDIGPILIRELLAGIVNDLLREMNEAFIFGEQDT